MNIFNLTFSDIMQDKILYYDKDVEPACFDICNTIKIDFLPDYDSKYYFEIIDNTFVKKEITENIKLNTNDKIFDENNILKFQNNNHNVIFVFNGNILSGVVHFADYNRNKVLKTIQDDILTFEINLREFLILNGKKNQDIIGFFEYRIANEKNLDKSNYYSNRLQEYNRKIKFINNIGPFQSFYLSDLMEYCCSSFSNKLFLFENHNYKGKSSSASQIISDIRNIAMHGKNPIEIDIESSIYSIYSLLNLKTALDVLTQYNTLLEELIHDNEDYKLALKLENINKLNIIHKHHPRALKYFIGY